MFLITTAAALIRRLRNVAIDALVSLVLVPQVFEQWAALGILGLADHSPFVFPGAGGVLEAPEQTELENTVEAPVFSKFQIATN